jgi:hypothetical protein
MNTFSPLNFILFIVHSWDKEQYLIYEQPIQNIKNNNNNKIIIIKAVNNENNATPKFKRYCM